MRRALHAAAAVFFLMLCCTGCEAAPDVGLVTEPPVTSAGTAPTSTAEPPPSALATTITTTPAPDVSFVVPLGAGEGHVEYVTDAEGTWGLTSFCVLPDKSVAILDCGAESIHLYSHSGEPLSTIDLGGITITPMDIQWWNESVAILEMNTEPKSVILIDPDGEVRRTIELWPGMDETAQGFRIGPNGELELLVPGAGIQVLTDRSGEPLPTTEMQETHAAYAFRGGPEFQLRYRDGEGTQFRLAGASDWFRLEPSEAVGWLALASDDFGNTYLRGDRIVYDSSGWYSGGDTFVARVDSDFRQTGFAPISTAGMSFYPQRLIDVTGDGNVYAMLPKADGVHIETLEFSPTLPELVSETTAEVVISGPAVVERPEGTELFALKWGKEPGRLWHEFWEQGAPSQNGFELAVSPDGETIAIYDYANHRVKLFARDGTLRRAIPLSSMPGLADIAYDGLGRLFALRYSDSAFLLPPGDGEAIVDIPLRPDIIPWELATDGSDVWVRDIGGALYKIAGRSGALASGEQLTTGEAYLPPTSAPAGAVGFSVVYGGKRRASIFITDRGGGSGEQVRISSPDLPLDEIRTFGHDAAGNLYVMARIYAENWPGTESWCFIGVSPDGAYLGQLRLPLDFWAGGGWAVTPSGTILELRSTKAGIVATEYEVRR